MPAATLRLLVPMLPLCRAVCSLSFPGQLSCCWEHHHCSSSPRHPTPLLLQALLWLPICSRFCYSPSLWRLSLRIPPCPGSSCSTESCQFYPAQSRRFNMQHLFQPSMLVTSGLDFGVRMHGLKSCFHHLMTTTLCKAIIKPQFPCLKNWG